MRLTHALLTPFLVLVVAVFAGLQAGEIEGPKETVPADQFVVVRYKLEKGDDVVWKVTPKPSKSLTYTEKDYSYLVFNGPSDTKYEVEADWINWETKKRGRPTYEVVIGKAPTPPPVPPAPEPKPKPPGPDPKPVPVTSFYVVLVWESGTGLTAAQNSVFNGAVVEKWLTEKCTRDGKYNGWRRRDRDDATTGDTPTMNELWGKAKAALGTDSELPAAAIAVNGKVVIEPLHKVDPAGRKTTYTPQEFVALLESYLSGSRTVGGK